MFVRGGELEYYLHLSVTTVHKILYTLHVKCLVPLEVV